MDQEGSSHFLQKLDSVQEWINSEHVEVESEAEKESNQDLNDGKLMRFDGVANQHWWDAIIVAGDEEFYVAKGHLAQHSPVFADMFLAAEKNNEKEFVVEELDPSAFQTFLEIINGEPGLTDENVEEVLKIAKKYSASTAMKACELYLIRDSKFYNSKKLCMAVKYDLDELKEVARQRNQSFSQLGIDDLEAERRKEKLQEKLEEATRLYHHSCEQLKKQMALDKALKNEEKRRDEEGNESCHRCGNVYGNEDQWENEQDGVGYVDQSRNVNDNQWGFGNGNANGNGYQFGNVHGNGVRPVYQCSNGHAFQFGNGHGNGVGYVHQGRYPNGYQWRNPNGNTNGYQFGNGDGNGNGHVYQLRHPNRNQMGNANVFQWGNGNSNVNANANANAYQWGAGSANGAPNPFQFGHSQN